MVNPWMHDTEIHLVLKHLYYTDTMLEWGSGGSTLYFSQFVKNYYSIEHDKEWYGNISQYQIPNLKYYHVPRDLPISSPSTREQYQTYIEHIHTLGIKKFDKIFIDGRGRGWCAEEVIPYLHKDSIVFMHDFWNRPQYHIVFEWYDEIASIKTPGLQTIVALKLKNKFLI